jgi:tRNA threonylcarbamoyladenosine biosynthesis protein TsaB
MSGTDAARRHGREHSGGDPLLALDTATQEALVALAGLDGVLRAVTTWTAGFRHGEELLARLDGLLSAEAVDLASVAGIVVGTGPGAFTGLRVGLATAKGLAHGLGCPIVGISTGAALLEAARASGASGPLALLLPAGPSDRVLVTREPGGPPGQVAARRLVGGEEPDLPSGTAIVAVDLAGRASPKASELGAAARVGLAAALASLGSARLAKGDADDAATLVPEYVTLPRGVVRAAGQVTMERV